MKSGVDPKVTINVDKMKESDFRRPGKDHHTDLTTNGAAVDRVSSV